jgi:hypothetical protein
MSELTLDEIMEKRAELETALEAAIKHFEYTTDLTVDDIQIDRASIFGDKRPRCFGVTTRIIL